MPISQSSLVHQIIHMTQHIWNVFDCGVWQFSVNREVVAC